MTKNDKNLYTTIEVTGFQQICKELATLKEENKKLLFENNKLKEELMNIKSMGMFEFADKYCNDKQLADAGHAFARSLGIGVPMTHEDIVIEAAENCYVPYTAEDF